VRWLARLVGQVALGLLVLELALRLYNPIPFRVHRNRIILPVHQVYTFDNHGASKLDPITHHTKNSLGFRGPDPPHDFARRLTILTIGGSTTECLFLSDGKTWTDGLARALAVRWPDAWVNNAGLDGQSTYGHLVLLRTIVVDLRPTIAMFLVGANDVGRDAANTYDTALVPNRPRWRALATAVFDHSEVLSVAENLLRAERARQRGFGHSQIDLVTARHLTLDGREMEAIAEKYRPSLDGYAARLADVADVCRANGIEPVFITQPALFGDTNDPATGVDLRVVQVNGGENGTLEWRVLEMTNDVTRRVAAARHVFLIDLAREMPKDSRLFYDFLHFTNEGAQRVSEIVAEHLAPHLSQMTLPQSH
jgi:lysophospholipase L1-like esterase